MISTLNRLVARVRQHWELARYDDYTVAALLRKQGAKIGEHCRIQVRHLGSEPFLVSIGNHCTIASEVFFMTHDGGAWIFTEQSPSLQRFGRVDVLDNCFIGYRATLMPGVRIGPNAVVGACSLVTHDVPPDSVVAGSPARVLSTIDDYRAKLLAAWNRQRPPGYMADLHDGHPYSPARIFAAKLRDWRLLRDHLLQIEPPP